MLSGAKWGEFCRVEILESLHSESFELAEAREEREREKIEFWEMGRR